MRAGSSFSYVILLLAAMLASAAVQAEPALKLSGYTTLGVAYSKTREVDAVGSLMQPGGVGRGKPVSLGVDTRGGLQATAYFGGGVEAALQVVADRRADNSYTPEVEWAHLTWQATPDTWLRAGRVVAPVFMVSTYRNVGYAQIPVRQSWDVYSLNPLTHLDGIDHGMRVAIDAVGPGVLSSQLTVGRVAAKLASATFDGRAALGSLLYERGVTGVRAGYGRYKLDFDVTDPALPVDLYRQVIDSGIARQLLGYPTPNLKLTDIDMSMWSVGFQHDPGDWFLHGEQVRRKAEGTLIQNVAAWYLLAGWRVGDAYKPYVSYASMRSIQPELHPAARAPDCSGWTLGSDLLCDAAYLVNAIDAVSNQRVVQRTWSVGVRYDFLDNAAIKLQYDRIAKPGDAHSETIGQFPITPTGGWPGDWLHRDKRIGLWSATLDVVF